MHTYAHIYGDAIEITNADQSALLNLLPTTQSKHHAIIEPTLAQCGCVTAFTVTHLDSAGETIAVHRHQMNVGMNIGTRRYLMRLLMNRRMNCTLS